MAHGDPKPRVLRETVVDRVRVSQAVAAVAGWGWMSLVGAVIAVSWLLFFLGGGNAEKPRP